MAHSLNSGHALNEPMAPRTFKPKKNIPEGSHQHELMKHAAATLGSGNNYYLHVKF